MSATTKTPAPPSAAESQRRDEIVAAAKADRKIIDEAEWRAAFDRSPVSTERLLTAASNEGGLAPGAAPAGSSAPLRSEQLLERSRVRMGAAPAAASAPPAKDEALLAASRARMGTAKGPTGSAAEEALMEASRRRMDAA